MVYPKGLGRVPSAAQKDPSPFFLSVLDFIGESSSQGTTYLKTVSLGNSAKSPLLLVTLQGWGAFWGARTC